MTRSATYDLKSLCESVSIAIEEVRATFQSDIPISETLDRFWALQDYTSRLLDALSENPQTLSHIDTVCPGLVRKVVDVLAFAPKTRAGSVPAIISSIHLTSRNLEEIEYLRQSRSAQCVSRR